MDSFFITLLYIIIGFWILRIILKWAFPYLIKFFIQYIGKKAKKQYDNSNQNPFQNSQSSSNQSDPKAKQSDKEKVGEYIDFEEID
jgi:hypothetical protein